MKRWVITYFDVEKEAGGLLSGKGYRTREEAIRWVLRFLKRDWDYSREELKEVEKELKKNNSTSIGEVIFVLIEPIII